MLIVDAQVHIWTSGTPVHVHRQVPAYTKDELLKDMDAAGVDAAVLHPPSWDEKANEVAIEAAAQHPDRLSVLGFFDVSRPESRSLMDRLMEQPGMLGLRFAFLRPGQENWLVDGTMDWLWPLAARSGLPVGLLVPRRLKAVDALAARHPDLKLMVDHMACPRGTQDAAAFANLDDLVALARHPNVAVKATGMASLSTEPFPFADLHPHIRSLINAFGPRRTFWGTDLTRMRCTYYECIKLFTEHLPWLDGEDLDWVMGRGVCEWLDWPL